MIRKFAIAAAAVAALGTASLTVGVTPAAAKGGHGHHGHGHHGHGHHGPKGHGWRVGYGLYSVGFAYVDDCLRTAWVETPWGPRRRLINICD